MKYATIRWEPDGVVATLRLHRPDRMNAVIEAMYREIGAALDAAAADPAVRAVILTGCELSRQGVVKQAFCAGADLKAHASVERTPQQRRAYIELAHATTLALWRFLVAAIHPLPALLPAARELGRRLAAQAPLALAGAKRLLQRSWADSLEAALGQETETILRLMETEDWREGARAFAERREPRFEGR